jgi:hypothetical protein
MGGISAGDQPLAGDTRSNPTHHYTRGNRTMIPDIPGQAQMEKDYIDVTVSSIIALLAGWLIKSFSSASRKELDEIRQEMKHFVTTRSFDKELNGLQARLDRIEEKIDKLMSQ